MKCVLKTNDGVMIKSIDTANTTLELTTDINEAFNYVNGEWFAKSELEFLQFHFKKDYPEVMNMHCEWVNEDKDSASMYTIAHAPIVGDVVEAEDAPNEPMDEAVFEPRVYVNEVDHVAPQEVIDYNMADVVGTLAATTGPTIAVADTTTPW